MDRKWEGKGLRDSESETRDGMKARDCEEGERKRKFGQERERKPERGRRES